jgi:hypothetical protein
MTWYLIVDIQSIRGYKMKDIDRDLIMKTIEEMQEKLEWLIKALDYPENQTMVQQCKIYAQIDLLRWLGVPRKG